MQRKPTLEERCQVMRREQLQRRGLLPPPKVEPSPPPSRASRRQEPIRYSALTCRCGKCNKCQRRYYMRQHRREGKAYLSPNTRRDSFDLPLERCPVWQRLKKSFARKLYEAEMLEIHQWKLRPGRFSALGRPSCCQ